MVVKKNEAEKKNSPNGIAWIGAIAVLVEAIPKLLDAIDRIVR